MKYYVKQQKHKAVSNKNSLKANAQTILGKLLNISVASSLISVVPSSANRLRLRTNIFKSIYTKIFLIPLISLS